MRELDLKQSIALCLVYLAKGYEFKFHTKADSFILSCAETTLQYDDRNLNAMLLKAEFLENKLVAQHKDIEELQLQKDFKNYQQWITHIFELGYREMPFEMKNKLIKGWTRDTLIQLTTKDYRSTRANNPKFHNERYAGLSWGVFDEEIRTKPLERYGRTIFDTKTHKVVGFVNNDVLLNQYNFDPVVFAWNVDPLASKQPAYSPYSAMGDNPIWFIDKDGLYFTGSTKQVVNLYKEVSAWAAQGVKGAAEYKAALERMDASSKDFLLIGLRAQANTFVGASLKSVFATIQYRKALLV